MWILILSRKIRIMWWHAIDCLFWRYWWWQGTLQRICCHQMSNQGNISRAFGACCQDWRNKTFWTVANVQWAGILSTLFSMRHYDRVKEMLKRGFNGEACKSNQILFHIMTLAEKPWEMKIDNMLCIWGGVWGINLSHTVHLSLYQRACPSCRERGTKMIWCWLASPSRSICDNLQIQWKPVDLHSDVVFKSTFDTRVCGLCNLHMSMQCTILTEYI